MSGHHHHRQAVNSLGKGNPSWAILGTVCTSRSPEEVKHKLDFFNGTQEGWSWKNLFLISLITSEYNISKGTVT